MKYYRNLVSVCGNEVPMPILSSSCCNSFNSYFTSVTENE